MNFAGVRMPAGWYRVNRERERRPSLLDLGQRARMLPGDACSFIKGRFKVNGMFKVLSCELEYPDLCDRSRVKIGVKKELPC